MLLRWGVGCQQKTSSPSGVGGGSANPACGPALRDEEYLVLADKNHCLLHLAVLCASSTLPVPQRGKATIPVTMHSGKLATPGAGHHPGSRPRSVPGPAPVCPRPGPARPRSVPRPARSGPGRPGSARSRSVPRPAPLCPRPRSVPRPVPGPAPLHPPPGPLWARPARPGSVWPGSVPRPARLRSVPLRPRPGPLRPGGPLVAVCPPSIVKPAGSAGRRLSGASARPVPGPAARTACPPRRQ